MAVKIVIADVKAGKSIQKEVEDAKFLMGMKIGDTFKGENIELTGYEFEITGGSDKVGFPMRGDVDRAGRTKILATGGIGINPSRKGQRMRKTVAGRIVGAQTAQINVKVIKYGATSLFEEPKEETAEGEAPAEEKTE